MAVWKQYIESQKKYSDIYGNRCICLMQVGSFYEIYSIQKEGYMKEVCEIMGIIVSQKNIGIDVNPYMAGVPDHGVKKFIDKLIQENYTVVIIDQIGPKNSKGGYDKRDVTKILSKTNVDLFFDINESNINTTNNLLSLYLEEEKTLQNKTVITAGMSVIDLNTGINHIYEINSNEYDVLEEVYRFVEGYNPSEMIIHAKNLKKYSKDEVVNRLNIMDRIYYYGFYDKKLEYFKLSYQEEFLKKIFTNTGMLNVVEYLNLHYKMYALNSYILLLQFAYEHEKNIIKNIRKPEIYNSQKHLILYNDALYQLNVVPNKIIKSGFNTKFKSLYDVINNTSTAIGRRELKNRLLNPITDMNELNRSYQMIETMMDKIDDYEVYLKSILDIDRYHRKLTLKILQPKEYATINDSYDNILSLIRLYHEDYKDDKNNILSEDDFNQFTEYLDEYQTKFNMEVMIKYDIKNIEESIFNEGVYPDIDEIQDKISGCKQYFNDLVKKYGEWMEKYENKKIKNNKKGVINLIYQEKQGTKNRDKKEGDYVITMTKRRGDILKQILNQKKISGYKFETHTKSEVKLISEEILAKSGEWIDNINKIDGLVRERYYEIMGYFDNKYNFENISKFIGEIDFIKSGAKTAKLYGYCQPEIIENDQSFINSKEIRHPIIERLTMGKTYIPNDIQLGSSNQDDGILLFGLNSSGKSSLMKSVGLNIILAQMGYYVAAKEFQYYPYHHIFTRISGDDNLFHGQSSFAVEMSELRSILNYADKNSLVLGDEVCRGTETISGLAIVSSALTKFSVNKINFIFATHLHKLSEMDRIKELYNVGIYHLAVNTNDGKLIYERKLKPGPGDSIYGLEVAKHLINDKEFIDLAHKIREELLNVPEYILQPKNSKYNANIYIDKCQICGKTYKEEQLDVHHILFQSQCNQDDLIEHVKKNDKSNLVVLCKTHHIAVHNKDLEIYGYQETNDGLLLDYKQIDKKEYENKKKSRLKYTEDDIKIIEKYRGKPISFTLNKLEKCHQIKISKTTLNKIFNGTYGN